MGGLNEDMHCMHLNYTIIQQANLQPKLHIESVLQSRGYEYLWIQNAELNIWKIVYVDMLVVVGAQLAILNNTLFILIQQGKILKSGRIDLDSTRWLPPKVGNREVISLESRTAFNLTRTVLPQNRVMTGLGLMKETIGRISFIGLKIHSLIYNSGYGELILPNALVSERPKVTHRQSTSHATTSTLLYLPPEDYVELTVSDGMDGGRRTIPHIDMRNVNTSTPLAGAGLYWKEGGVLGGYSPTPR
ncbi:hypothetical protein QAD02_005711 [Eretmocerus hayati]|uniref:Uncharacterized protein n=1 Tax=Eretmocerus hayati TaxID=131215 RepID=A0ACC2NVY0_9HYME|nr:hypothetical protein QAD02_005711 [Eretmocerus hayati]